MVKKLISILLIVIMAMMTLPGCSSKSDSDKNSSSDSNNECVANERVAEAARAAYMDIIEDNAEEIDNYDWQTDYDQNSMINNVAIEDINGDGVPELFFMTAVDERESGDGELHIYRYNSETESAEECEYVYNDNPSTSANVENEFVDHRQASGTNYIIYMSKADNSFYICSRISSGSTFCCSAEFHMDDNGKIKTINTVRNEYCGNVEYKRDIYYIDDKEVSSDSAVDMLKAHREDFGKVIMYSVNCGSEDMKVFEKVKGVTPCATSRTELMGE